MASHKNRLQEFFQKRHLSLPTYDSYDNGGLFSSVVTLCDGTKLYSSEHANKKAAEMDAAAAALEWVQAHEELYHTPELKAPKPTALFSNLKSEPSPADSSFKNILQEWLQASGMGVPSYSATSVGPPHSAKWYATIVLPDNILFNRPFTTKEVYPTKARAEQEAARMACIALGIHADPYISQEEAQQIVMSSNTAHYGAPQQPQYPQSMPQQPRHPAAAPPSQHSPSMMRPSAFTYSSATPMTQQMPPQMPPQPQQPSQFASPATQQKPETPLAAAVSASPWTPTSSIRPIITPNGRPDAQGAPSPVTPPSAPASSPHMAHRANLYSFEGPVSQKTPLNIAPQTYELDFKALLRNLSPQYSHVAMEVPPEGTYYLGSVFIPSHRMSIHGESRYKNPEWAENDAALQACFLLGKISVADAPISATGLNPINAVRVIPPHPPERVGVQTARTASLQAAPTVPMGPPASAGRFGPPAAAAAEGLVGVGANQTLSGPVLLPSSMSSLEEQVMSIVSKIKSITLPPIQRRSGAAAEDQEGRDDEDEPEIKPVSFEPQTPSKPAAPGSPSESRGLSTNTVL